MAKKESFFIKENEVGFVPDEEYTYVEPYVQLLDAFARTTYKSIYVIDYFRKDFFYVSDNPLFLCGLSPEEVRRMGYDFYLRFVPEPEIPLLLEINRAGFTFTESVPPANRLEYTLSYDFHIKPSPGKPLLINHKITPLRLNGNKVWLSLCTVSFSSKTKPGNMEIARRGYTGHWKYSPVDRKWHECARIILKEEEKEVLRLSMQGYTMKDISEHVSKSLDTVKTYKRRIFEKLEVENITEAISYAINNNLL